MKMSIIMYDKMHKHLFFFISFVLKGKKAFISLLLLLHGNVSLTYNTFLIMRKGNRALNVVNEIIFML